NPNLAYLHNDWPPLKRKTGPKPGLVVIVRRSARLIPQPEKLRCCGGCVGVRTNGNWPGHVGEGDRQTGRALERELVLPGQDSVGADVFDENCVRHRRWQAGQEAHGTRRRNPSLATISA